MDHRIQRLAANDLSAETHFYRVGERQRRGELETLQKVLQVLLDHLVVEKDETTADLSDFLVKQRSFLFDCGFTREMITDSHYGLGYLCRGSERVFSWSTTCAEVYQFLRVPKQVLTH